MPAHRRAAFRGLRAAAPGGAPVFGHACLLVSWTSEGNFVIMT